MSGSQRVNLTVAIFIRLEIVATLVQGQWQTKSVCGLNELGDFSPGQELRKSVV